jgi:flagellar hook-associated protein 3 FlgL
MRVNPNSTPDLLAALARTQQEEQSAMLQIASGRRVNTPSDDPAAAAVLVQNHARAEQADQFRRSISSLQSQLQTADSTLNSVILALQRALTLGVQGANGTLSDANRASIAEELRGVQQHLLNLANTSFQGNYLFAGTATQIAPFTADISQPSGVRYNGNANLNRLTVGEGFSLPVNKPGSELFAAAGADMFQAVQDLIAAIQTGTGTDTAIGAVRMAFDSISALRSFYGNALNQLEAQQTSLNNEKLELGRQENIVGGADLATAASQLVNAQNARTAALQAAGGILRMSLFDFLK